MLRKLYFLSVVIFLVFVACSTRQSPLIPTYLPSPQALSSTNISFAIEEVICPGSRTLVKVLVEVDRSYWGDLDASPPPGAMLQDVELIDEEGRSYLIDAAWSEMIKLDPSTGKLQFHLTAAFEEPACAAKELVFESGLELRGISSDETFEVDLRNRDMGEEWGATGKIELAGMSISVEKQRLALISSLENGTLVEQPSLEFYVLPIVERGLRLNCLEFIWIDPEIGGESWGCASDTDLIVFSIIGGPVENALEHEKTSLGQTEFRVVGSVVLIEPRKLTWSFGDP